MNTRHFLAAILIYGISFYSWASEPNTELAAKPYSQSSNDALRRFVQTKVEDHPRVKAAQYALSASKSFRSAAARPLYNPALELAVENAEVDTRTIGISQTLDWGGKRSARKKVASADQAQSYAQYQFTRQQVSIEILAALVANQIGQNRSALAVERVGLMQRFLDLSNTRFAAGDMPLIESNLAKLVYAEARMQRATTAADAVEAEQTLSTLTNLTIGNDWPELDNFMPRITDVANAESRLSSLPLVQIAQYQVESAKAVALLRKRQRRLDPTIGITGGEEGSDNLVGLTISIPIPLLNRFNNESVAANQLYLQEAQIFENVKRRARARLESAHKRYQIALNAWQEWQQVGQPSIQRQGDHLRQLWESGELSMTDFLVQTDQTINSQNSALDLQHSLWRASLEWLAASGDINQWLSNEKAIIKTKDQS